MKYDLFHNNADFFAKVKCPVLVIGGEKDLQVLPHHVNLIKEGIEKGGNKRVTAILYPGKNHLMQDAITGSPSEYGDIENTIAPDVVADIVSWIKKL
jgi:dienelactone hydrolase